jgi:hypothetical protein
MFPALIGSLKVTVITLLVGMLVVPLVGLMFVTLGVGSTVKLELHNANGLPAKSVILLAFKVKLYFVSFVNSLVGVIVRTLPLIEVVNDTAVPLLLLSVIPEL